MRGLFCVVVFTSCVSHPPALAERTAAAIFRDERARGGALVLDVASGEVVASVGVGRDVDGALLPLSIVKLYVAAMWWDHDLGDGDFVDPRKGHVTIRDVLVDGWDRPGEEMGIELRRRFGGQAVLAEVGRLGLTLHLAAEADDAAWGSALSIGEHDAAVTLRSVSKLLRAIARSEFVRSDTARRLQSAMLDAVARGTARGADAPLAGTTWQLGGKTGSGPAGVTPSDGWFAGLVFDRGEPRYTVAVYVDGRGGGGGVAASVAARIARALICDTI
jgi:hypothetical protein